MRTLWSCWYWVSGYLSILAAGQFLFLVLTPGHGPYPLHPDKAGISPISFLGGYDPLLSNVLNVSFALLVFVLFCFPSFHLHH